MACNANEQLAKQQGAILEMEQQYNLATSDLQITMLTAKQNKYLFNGLIITLVAISTIIILVLRFKNNRDKTRQLLGQIEELTALQLVKKEEAEIEAKKEERKKLGQELHDDLAASIAGVLQYMRIKTSMETNLSEKRLMEKVCAVLESSYEKTRAKSHEIYNRENDDQFIIMLKDYINLFFMGSGIKVDAIIDDVGLEKLSTQIKTNILLIIKEAISNIIKHAKAETVSICLYSDNKNIHIEVEDDGVGILKRNNATQLLGLLSIKYRVGKINGHFNVETKLSGGTLLKVMLMVS